MGATSNSEVLPSQQQVAQKTKIDEAKELLQKIDDTFIGDQEYFDRLDVLLFEVDKKNTQEKERLLALLDDALKEDSKFSWADKKDIRKLKEKWLASYEVAEVKKEKEETTIQAATSKKTDEVKQKAAIRTASFTRREKAGKDLNLDIEAINDADPNKSLQARLAFLSDMDGMSGVENNNKLFGRGDQKYIIGEKQLYNVLSHTIANQEQLDKLFARFWVIGEWKDVGGMKSMREDFRDKVLTRASVVASMARIVLGDQNAGAGLVSVIEGREKDFIDTLMKDPEQFKKIKTEIESNSPLGVQIVSTIISVGLGFLLKGFHFSLEHRDIDKGHPLAVILGDKVNFTAKLRVLEGAIQGNINDRETQIIRDTLVFADKMNGSIGTDKILKIPADMELSKDEKEIVEFYNTNVTKLPKGSDIVLVDELSRRYMLNLAKSEAGWSGKGVEAGYSLLSMKAYAGLTVQHIGSRIQAVGNNGAVAAEGRSNAKTIKLEEMGITAEKTADKKIKYILPAMDIIPEELAEFGVVMEDGKVVLISDAPLDFHRDTIYHINGDIETRVTINKKDQPTISVPSETHIVPQEGVSKSAQRARERFNEAKTLGGSIYVMSRNSKKYPQFDTMLQQIGDRKYEEAYHNLQAQSKYSQVAKHILSLIKADGSNRDQVLQAINTYTYGSAAKNAKSINTKEYKRNRDKKTVAAEDRLSPRNGVAEAFFSSEKNHTPTHINTILPGQALSVSVFATPKGGTHRIDKYDGSIEVGGQLYIDGQKGAIMNSAQKNRIMADHAPAIQKNMDELNAYLKTTKTDVQLTLSEYTKMLETGVPSDSLKKIGVVMNKKPQFFEARAMINGNVCVNRVDGLAFPTFQAPELPPQIVNVPENITEGFGAIVGVKKAIVTDANAGLVVGSEGGGKGEETPQGQTGTSSDPNAATGGLGGNAGGSKG